LGAISWRDASFIEAMPQGLPFQQFRDDIRSRARKADIVDGKNVWVIQRRGGSRFLLESPEVGGVVTGFGPDQLEGDIATEPFIVRAEDLSHSSSAYFFEDPVVPDALPDHSNSTNWDKSINSEW